MRTCTRCERNMELEIVRENGCLHSRRLQPLLLPGQTKLFRGVENEAR